VIASLSLLDSWRGRVIFDEFQRSAKEPGDAIECGVYRGGTALMLGLMIKSAGYDKKVRLCDTFAGLPRPNRRYDKIYDEGSMRPPRGEITKAIRVFGLKGTCVLHKGLFERSFARMPRALRFCFAHIDCDMFLGSKQCLDFLHTRMSRGTSIVVDDYYDESHGVMRAVNAFAEKTGTIIYVGTPGQAILRSGETPATTTSDWFEADVGDHRVFFSAEPMKKNEGFVKWLRESRSIWDVRMARLDRFVRLFLS
jgi:O-methyltransferase